MVFRFNVRIGDQVWSLSEDDIAKYATRLGLDHVAPGRYAHFFVAQILLGEQIKGIDPSLILDELRVLEGEASETGTKPATQFEKPPLKGLWHKHFFSPSLAFIAKNIKNQLSSRGGFTFAESILGTERSPIITEEMIGEFVDEVTVGSMEKRAKANKLTGEWIVFARHNDENYYLCLATHSAGDQKIYEQIKQLCWPQFPFLQTS